MGQLLNMPRAEYDALRDRANFSTLKVLAKSPAHYRDALRVKRESTDALKVGRATHLAVFEPEVFAAEVVVWRGGRRAGKEWEAFEARHSGKEILTEAEAQQVEAIATAVRTHPDAAALLEPRVHEGRRYEGVAERTLLWTDAITGIECKARLDWISPLDVIVDLKTAEDASLEVFEPKSWRLGYHVQAAFYADGLHAVTGERAPYSLIVVEKARPFVVQVYDMPDDLLAKGRFTYRRWLARLADCRRTDTWPGYAAGPLALSAPTWADKSSEPDEEISE